jgi:hypothetical protein
MQRAEPSRRHAGHPIACAVVQRLVRERFCLHGEVQFSGVFLVQDSDKVIALKLSGSCAPPQLANLAPPRATLVPTSRHRHAGLQETRCAVPLELMRGYLTILR